MAQKSDSDVLDVAIVGGGISGVYSGWRLLTGGKAPRIALYEMSNRIGGRLLSVVPPGIPNARVELGGMRYTSGHKRVLGLVNHLKLATEPFPVSEPQNIAYVRGHLLRQQDLANADAVPYDLGPDERSPDTLNLGFTAVAAMRALRVICGKDVSLKDVDWTTIAKNGRYKGYRLSDLPMEYLIRSSVSQEAFAFAQDTSGYNSIMHTWNAADGFPWNLADFGLEVTYFHVKDGYDRLPLMIADSYKKAGGAIHLGHRLKSFDQARLPDGSTGVSLEIVGADGKAQTQLARKLILAMPRRSLELLNVSALAPAQDLITSVTPIPLFKLTLCYSYPWWQTLDAVQVPDKNGKLQPAKITQGESITDMPIRMMYYWAVDEKTQNAVVLIYDDGTNLDYWAGLRNAKVAKKFAAAAATSDASSALPPWNDFPAPQLMVEEAHRQLVEMHGVQNRPDIPAPYAAAYRDWGEDPFGGGAYFWHVNVDSPTVFERILQPVKGLPVHICGEAYSNYQGWVEGPLETADRMLEVHFGLDPPSWLSAQGRTK